MKDGLHIYYLRTEHAEKYELGISTSAPSLHSHISYWKSETSTNINARISKLIQNDSKDQKTLSLLRKKKSYNTSS